ncbi:MAG: hypothetical protein P1U32_08665, partial [Legionellaceae bacterium]|nr:hypothetical protein [Legionellaceae bacterium]
PPRAPAPPPPRPPPRSLRALIALSAYLPLTTECHVKLSTKTPMFIASGSLDPIVLPLWTEKTVAWIRERGFNALTVKDYPMEHSVCFEEVEALAEWCAAQMADLTVVGGVS